MSIRKPVVLITGASSGIGLAVLKILSHRPDRYRVVATARASSLPKFAEAGFTDSDTIRLRSLDVTRLDECESVMAEIEADWGGVDILINNAGIAFRSVVEHVSEADVQLQFGTNVFGPLHLSRLCLPGMRRKRAGRIINVSSVGGMMAMPTMGLYSASKFALEGFSEALYYEMLPWNIHVSLIQPGFVRSKSFKNIYMNETARNSVLNSTTYANYYWHMGKFIAKLMNNARATPKSIAKKIVRTMEAPNPPLRIPTSIDARIFTLMTRLVPRRIYHRVLYRQLPGIESWGSGNHQALEAAKNLDDIIPKRASQQRP